MLNQAPQYILSVRGLKKSYGDLVAVKDLSFEVLRGEVFGFLGPNGAGKTTAIMMICGLLSRNGGEIRVNGRSLAADYHACKRLIGLCPENIVIWESLTCLEQLEFIGQQYDLTRQASRAKGIQLLEQLGLAEKRDKLARTLSSGMKRRLNIALALIHSPRILIMDEPQAGLDPGSRILVRKYIRALSEDTTVILTTHDMDEADRLADRIAIIDHGELLVLDTPENLKEQVGSGDILELDPRSGQGEKLRRFLEFLPDSLQPLTLQQDTLQWVGVDALRLMPHILGALQSSQVEILDLTIRKVTLEDVFIALTGRRLSS